MFPMGVLPARYLWSLSNRPYSGTLLCHVIAFYSSLQRVMDIIIIWILIVNCKLLTSVCLRHGHFLPHSPTAPPQIPGNPASWYNLEHSQSIVSYSSVLLLSSRTRVLLWERVWFQSGPRLAEFLLLHFSSLDRPAYFTSKRPAIFNLGF